MYTRKKYSYDINIPICVYSHSSVFDVLKIQFDYMSKIFMNKSQKIYLFVDKKYDNYVSLNYETILYNDKLSYNKRLTHCISYVKHKYFILTHENDILINYNKNTIINLVNIMNLNNIDSIILRHYNNCKKNIKVSDNLSISPVYNFKVQPRIWKKTSSIELFKSIPNKNYKSIENSNVQEYIKVNQKIYSLCCKNPIQSVLSMATAIDYIYIHITSAGKFFEANTNNVSPIIKKEYINIYNKYIKNSERGTSVWGYIREVVYEPVLDSIRHTFMWDYIYDTFNN
jgi:hypothetical protein